MGMKYGSAALHILKFSGSMAETPHSDTGMNQEKYLAFQMPCVVSQICRDQENGGYCPIIHNDHLSAMTTCQLLNLKPQKLPKKKLFTEKV